MASETFNTAYHHPKNILFLKCEGKKSYKNGFNYNICL